MRVVAVLAGCLLCACFDFSTLKDCPRDWYCEDFEDGGWTRTTLAFPQERSEARAVAPGHGSGTALEIVLRPVTTGYPPEWSPEWSGLKHKARRDFFLRGYVRVLTPRSDAPVLLSAFRGESTGANKLFLHGTRLGFGPNTSFNGGTVSTAGWTCLEWEVKEGPKDGGVIRAWLDDTFVGEEFGDTFMDGENAITKVKYGAQLNASYDGGVQDAGFSIVWDDVVVASERIGCGPLQR